LTTVYTWANAAAGVVVRFAASIAAFVDALLGFDNPFQIP
jgi:hypothetical protein